jgi:hypothetical protein
VTAGRAVATGVSWLLCGVALFSPARAQSSDSAANPEMARLASVLEGNWATAEIVQHGKPVPEGAGRRGTIHVRLAGGGTVLVSEGSSAGAVGGVLHWHIAIWWAPDEKQYRVLACFKAPRDAGCELRGTARWVGDTFVNDYEELVDGKRTKMQDVWTDIARDSYTVTEAHEGNGVMKAYVVSHNTRE